MEVVDLKHGDWKSKVDAWIDDRVKQADEDEEDDDEDEGLACPPLDEGAFFINPLSMDLTHFFDDVDKIEPKIIEEKDVLKKRSTTTIGVCGPGIGKPHNLISLLRRQKDLASNDQNEEASCYKAKLEASKRKLHDRYQESENAKKQRKIQVLELCDLPKQNPVQKNNKPTRRQNGRASNKRR